jgi:DNA-binding MarR family transcriptional regulator
MDDPLTNLPGYVLRRASIATMGRLHEHLAVHNLRATEASLILLIGSTVGLTQSDAGKLLGIKRANMTPMTAKLEARGLLARHQISGRSQELSLTPDGQKMLANVHSVITQHEDDMMSRVPEDLRAHVLPVLLALWGKDGGGD